MAMRPAYRHPAAADVLGSFGITASTAEKKRAAIVAELIKTAPPEQAAAYVLCLAHEGAWQSQRWAIGRVGGTTHGDESVPPKVADEAIKAVIDMLWDVERESATEGAR